MAAVVSEDGLSAFIFNINISYCIPDLFKHLLSLLPLLHVQCGAHNDTKLPRGCSSQTSLMADEKL